MLEVNGVIYEDESEMIDQAVQFYKNLYKETEVWRPFVEGLEFDQLEGLERDWLERRFEKEEVLQVVKELKEIKLPILMVSLWLSITIVGELWKEMS